MKSKIFTCIPKPDEFDHIAPDGSEIRLLSSTAKGGCVHCLLPAGKTSSAVTHQTVEEIWYILSGKGEMWQRLGEQEEVVILKEGIGLTIPTGNHFQFRNTGTEPLCILIVTMPPWPGPEEAVAVEGKWK